MVLLQVALAPQMPGTSHSSISIGRTAMMLNSSMTVGTCSITITAHHVRGIQRVAFTAVAQETTNGVGTHLLTTTIIDTALVHIWCIVGTSEHMTRYTIACTYLCTELLHLVRVHSSAALLAGCLVACSRANSSRCHCSGDQRDKWGQFPQGLFPDSALPLLQCATLGLSTVACKTMFHTLG